MQVFLCTRSCDLFGQKRLAQNWYRVSLCLLKIFNRWYFFFLFSIDDFSKDKTILSIYTTFLFFTLLFFFLFSFIFQPENTTQLGPGQHCYTTNRCITSVLMQNQFIWVYTLGWILYHLFTSFFLLSLWYTYNF